MSSDRYSSCCCCCSSSSSSWGDRLQKSLRLRRFKSDRDEIRQECSLWFPEIIQKSWSRAVLNFARFDFSPFRSHMYCSSFTGKNSFVLPSPNSRSFCSFILRSMTMVLCWLMWSWCGFSICNLDTRLVSSKPLQLVEHSLFIQHPRWPQYSRVKARHYACISLQLWSKRCRRTVHVGWAMTALDLTYIVVSF